MMPAHFFNARPARPLGGRCAVSFGEWANIYTGPRVVPAHIAHIGEKDVRHVLYFVGKVVYNYNKIGGTIVISNKKRNGHLYATSGGKGANGRVAPKLHIQRPYHPAN